MDAVESRLAALLAGRARCGCGRTVELVDGRFRCPATGCEHVELPAAEVAAVFLDLLVRALASPALLADLRTTFHAEAARLGHPELASHAPEADGVPALLTSSLMAGEGALTSALRALASRVQMEGTERGTPALSWLD